MSPSDIGLLIAIIILLVFSALFSACETAYSAANKVRLRTMESDGSKAAAKMLKKLEKHDQILSAVLTGNNIVNLTAASLSTLLFISLLKNDSLAASLSTIVLTVVILVFCEITPKIIAKENPEKTGIALGLFLTGTMALFFPLTWLFAQWKKLLKKVFRIKSGAGITEDELLTYVETAASEGGIEKHESKLIKSAIEFEDVDVEDIMVPRVHVIAVSDDESLESIKEKFVENEFSRMPVYSGTIDSVIGILHEKDFQKHCLNGEKSVKEVLQHIICVARTMKISVVLRMMQKARVHMAVVVDEFGGTSGVVTLEDILEELVGEIWDEHDEEEILMRRTDEDTFIVSGTESLSEMFDTLGIKTNEEFDSATVGGFVTEIAGKIPLAGEKISFERLEITVTKANVKRVLEVKIKLLPTDEEE